MSNYYQKDIETAPYEELKKIQDEKIVATVKRVYENVEPYRKKMDEAGVKPEDIKGVDDLYKLPFTSKQDMRDNYPFGLCAVPREDVVRIQATSGTTGKQVIGMYTENDVNMWSECTARAIVAAGGSKEDIVHISYGYGLFTGGLGLHGGSSKLGCMTLPVSSGNTVRQLTLMRDLGSTILCCTPSYAAYLAEALEEEGYTKDDIKLKAGIFGAEPWTEEMRQDIEEKLGIKAYDIYGLTEVIGPGVSFECECQQGMHVNEDHFIAEIIDPDTLQPLPIGEQGELVFTSLDKEAMPVMRYRTRDICRLSREKCSCGRTFVRMAKPRGRTDDMLIIRGVNVFPSQIEAVLMANGYTSNYLIILDRVRNTDTFEIQVEMTAELFSDTHKDIAARQKALVEELRSALGISPKVTIVAPHSIERSTGKAVRVIDKRKLIN